MNKSAENVGWLPYVEIRGTADATTEGADEHIDRLATKYTGRDFRGRRPGVERIKFMITPQHVRHLKLG